MWEMNYAASLSAIPERHAVLFGKASTCENPVLIRLNDRDRFISAFRAVHPPSELPESADVEENESEDADDDFGFLE